ncbi:DUF1854 domain-containing protein [Chitinimonas sp. BJYL2]|uniref:cyanophycin metabolism-associated DUF1854 family protein n=1 Tax=Chitinimonas sp. BJYL2 TaxID=2976696 RepID=UPI0022B378A9|nr:DUF1854 domain-containing protein [Chitinimonas sp. BJYL2]
MSQPDFQLARDGFGRLRLTLASGEQHDDVIPVRAFPISAPEEGLSLVDRDGHELVWIAKPAMLPVEARKLITEALAQREFMPEIRQLISVSTFATPSTWTVETNRGTTRFILRGEEDIRRAGDVLLVADSHGIQFLIRDPDSLDKHSRRLLDRFL